VVYQYLLLYKPYNVLSQFTDDLSQKNLSEEGVTATAMAKPLEETVADGRLTLKSFISVPDVYAVGRLDRDSEGLLLLTDDGPMQHRLSHPKFAHQRQYWVQVEGIPDDAALAQLRSGVTIRGYRTRPAQVRAIAPPDLPDRNPPIRYRKEIPTAWLEMTLSEGKNRQVRRMTAAVGYPTLRLVRSALRLSADCVLTLEGLQPGQWRSLTPQEQKQLPKR
jgi:23S rRNA pseudouridine2457 synthase